jgi:DNA-binding NarL/FixJ family response regulator
MKTVLVDDAPAVRRLLIQALSAMAGADVVGEATTPDEAMALIEATGAGLVVLDLHLAAGTGVDVLRRLQRLPTPPVALVFTNHALPIVRARCIAAGATNVFDKSRELDGLLEAAAHAIAAGGTPAGAH